MESYNEEIDKILELIINSEKDNYDLITALTMSVSDFKEFKEILNDSLKK